MFGREKRILNLLRTTKQKIILMNVRAENSGRYGLYRLRAAVEVLRRLLYIIVEESCLHNTNLQFRFYPKSKQMYLFRFYWSQHSLLSVFVSEYKDRTLYLMTSLSHLFPNREFVSRRCVVSRLQIQDVLGVSFPKMGVSMLGFMSGHFRPF